MKLEPKQLTVELICIDEGERARKDYKDIEALKASIQAEGLINPIAIMENGDGKYLLLAGGRRFRALTELGTLYVPCHVYPYIDDERIRRTIELKENIIRENLNYAEEAFLTREIHQLQVAVRGNASTNRSAEMGGQTLQDTAELLGKSVRTIRRDLEIAEAIDRNQVFGEQKTKADALKAIAAEKESIIIAELSKRARAKADSLGDKVKQQMLNNYIIGDVLETLSKIATSTYNLIELDPPYGIPMRRLVQMHHDGQIDLLGGERELSEEESAAFLTWMQNIFHEAYRVLKPDGWIVCWLALDPWLWPFADAIKNAGFVGGKLPALWIKNNGNTRTPNIHLQNRFEPFLYARKGEAVLVKPGTPNTFVFPIPARKVHPTEKPVELYMDILRVFSHPGAAVLSIFTGSGNILLAGANCQTPVIGIDIDQHNKDQFSARVLRTDPGKYTSY